MARALCGACQAAVLETPDYAVPDRELNFRDMLVARYKPRVFTTTRELDGVA